MLIYKVNVAFLITYLYTQLNQIKMQTISVTYDLKWQIKGNEK